MPDAGPTIQDDPRLGRAGELAAYLRENPRESRQDPEVLAKQFGIDPAIVARIQASSLVRGKRPKISRDRVSVTDLARKLGRQAENAFDSFPFVPYVYLTAISLASIVAIYMRSELGEKLVPAIWAVATGACYFFRPKFRYVLFAGVMLAILLTIRVGMYFGEEKTPSADTLGWSPWFLAALVGFSLFFVNLLLGGVVVILGGSLQIRNQRRRNASLSRQDLLKRMFALQEQLESLPAKPKKKQWKLLSAIRSRPLLWATLIAFIPGSMGALATMSFHVDPFALQNMQKTVAVTSHATFKMASVAVSPAYITLEMLASSTGIFFLVMLGFASNTWRKVWMACLGIVIGHCFVYAWGWPARGFGSIPLSLAVGSALSNDVTSICILLFARFSVGFNRALGQYRGGFAEDEASIVSELLEIRYRLSANPVQVCVLVVDAAGSTKMKKDADQLDVEYSFGQYQSWISQTVSLNGGKVDMMTGDGAICAFSTAQNALKAAEQLQAGVVGLNEKQNRLPKPFQLRIALHSGAVVADLDKVQFTEVIDVAAHVEKYSPIGGIALTAPLLSALLDLPAVTSVAIVDGVEVFALPASN